METVKAISLTDRQRLDDAIKEFRERDFWARMALNDGWNEVPEGALRRGKGIVFWHATEHYRALAPSGMLTAALHVKHFEVDTQEIADVFKKHGLVYAIDSDPWGGVVLLPQSERP